MVAGGSRKIVNSDWQEVDEGHFPVPYRSDGSLKKLTNLIILADCSFDRTTCDGVMEEYMHFPAIPVLIYYKIIWSRI